MESAEAVMENENNSNVESDTCTADSGQTRGVMCSTHIATSKPNNISSGGSFISVSNSYLPAGRKLHMNKNAGRVEFTVKITNEYEEEAETEKSADEEQNEEYKPGDVTTKGTENSKKLMTSRFLGKEDNALLSSFEISSKGQRRKEIQPMDVDDVTEQVVQNSLAEHQGSLKVNIGAARQIKNSEEASEFDCSEASKNSTSDPVATKYWDDEIDLLGEDSHDSDNQKSNTECESTSIDKDLSTLSDENRICLSDRVGSSAEMIEVDGSDGVAKVPLGLSDVEVVEVAKQKLTVADNTSPDTASCVTAKVKNRGGVLKVEDKINSAEEVHVTPGCNPEYGLASGENQSVRIMSSDNSIENGEVCSASKEQASQKIDSESFCVGETTCVSKNVTTEVDGLDSAASNISSFDSSVSRNSCSSELSKLAETPVDDVIKDSISGRESVKVITEVRGTEPQKLPSTFDADASVTDFARSSVRTDASLLQKKSPDISVEPTDITGERNKTSQIVDNNQLKKSEDLKAKSDIEIVIVESETSGEAEKSRGGQNGLVETSTVSSSANGGGTSMTQNANTRSKRDENDQDVVEILNIKKEDGISESNVPTHSVSGTSENEPAAVYVKQEPSAEKEDNDEDVIIIDDEGELVPVKKETAESLAAENGLDIQISGVSGQQHQLHADAEQISSAAAGEAKGRKDTSKSAKSKLQACIVCHKVCKCKYNIIRSEDMKHLCDDECFKQFRKNPTLYLKPSDRSVIKESLSHDTSAATLSSVSLEPSQPYKICAVCQLMNINARHPFCNWNGYDFCGNSCQEKFQAEMNACFFCHSSIPRDMGSMFSQKIGNDMRSFCNSKCFNEYREKSNLCSCCQQDLALVPGAFTALIGAEGKLKDFCSQACMKKMLSQPSSMENSVSDVDVLSVGKGTPETCPCSVCEKQCQMKYTVWFKNTMHKLCSDLCMSAFQYTNKISMGKCDGCGLISAGWEVQAHFIKYEGQVKRFCSEMCISVFRKTNSRLVSCGWCGSKKLNFDMIEGLDADNKLQLFCSCNCLSLYRVSLQATSNQAVPCNQCQKVVPAHFHLTMSDASVRNFCSYACVVTFQAQFMTKQVSPGFGAAAPFSATSPTQLQAQQQGVLAQPVQQQTPSVTKSRRGRKNSHEAVARQQVPAFPVISNVVSLAPQGGDLQVQIIQPLASNPPLLISSPGSTAEAVGGVIPSGDGKHQIIIQAEPPKAGKNKSLQCRPITQTKATSCRPHSQNKEVQTDEVPLGSLVLPVPVPVYIPMPTVMFTAPAPKIVPIPIPIPVPVFIPTTRKSVNGICRTIKEIVERIPADPLEAELLMMAEAVAADRRPEDSDTESEAGPEESAANVEELIGSVMTENKSSRKRKSVKRGDDLVQAALRLAEEMSDSVEDLETSVHPVAVSTDPPTQKRQSHSAISYDSQDDDDDDYIPSRPNRGRGAKRSNRGRPPSSRTKRQRVEKSYIMDDDSLQSEHSVQQKSAVPPSDVNHRLKFSYGVNAWHHWVVKKNAEIERIRSTAGGHRARLFPTDILKCTTDELNITLCMFVKEVRKPGGEEYSPDSIYYLCLGIQQYLYENNRIDSIFTDSYFETFTDCLHEILKTHQPKLNSQGQMLCRIEEEHLWESKQLGAHSPFVLLNTVIYFHTKHFMLKTSEDHMSLSFAQILKHWKKGVPGKGQSASSGKNVSLRFYCMTKKDGFIARKGKEGVPVYEVTENLDNPLRCPVKLYEFFLSKCPESIKSRSDIFYPVPERSCVPDSPVWYSTKSVDIQTVNKMLTRLLFVREIQEAHIHAQPIYV